MQKDWSFLHSLDLEKKPTTKNNNTIVCYANVSISFCLKFDHGFLDFFNCLSLSFSLLNDLITYHFFGINFTDGFTKLKLHNFLLVILDYIVIVAQTFPIITLALE